MPLVVAVLVIVALGAGAAYLRFGGSGLLGSGADTSSSGVEPDGQAGGNQVPPCPFTAEQVSELLGQPMTDSGNCLFGDGNGVAQITIETHSASSTEVTYDYSRDQATKIYAQVQDIDKGTKGYLAYKDIGGEAVVIGSSGGFTILMSSFERFEGAGYEPVLRTVIDALPL